LIMKGAELLVGAVVVAGAEGAGVVMLVEESCKVPHTLVLGGFPTAMHCAVLASSNDLPNILPPRATQKSAE